VIVRADFSQGPNASIRTSVTEVLHVPLDHCKATFMQLLSPRWSQLIEKGPLGRAKEASNDIFSLPSGSTIVGGRFGASFPP